TGPLLASEIDTQLMARSRRYEERRREGALESPFVRLVMPGFFEHWLRHHGKLGGQHKIPASRHDRFIADELSAMACFNAD
ncbi:MAG TPA: GH3 auxin-responsive promoter family protein, partial [Opitutus sp.]|nr:GH3 auxin-responsive promoter family protein [Opitutus sp.]